MAFAVFLLLALTLLLLYLGSRASRGRTRRFFDGAGVLVLTLMAMALLLAFRDVGAPGGNAEPGPPRGDVKKLLGSGQSKAEAEGLARRINKASGGDPCVKTKLLTMGRRTSSGVRTSTEDSE
jgi:hypothetical protein